MLRTFSLVAVACFLKAAYPQELLLKKIEFPGVDFTAQKTAEGVVADHPAKGIVIRSQRYIMEYVPSIREEAPYFLGWYYEGSLEGGGALRCANLGCNYTQIRNGVQTLVSSTSAAQNTIAVGSMLRMYNQNRNFGILKSVVQSGSTYEGNQFYEMVVEVDGVLKQVIADVTPGSLEVVAVIYMGAPGKKFSIMGGNSNAATVWVINHTDGEVWRMRVNYAERTTSLVQSWKANPFAFAYGKDELYFAYKNAGGLQVLRLPTSAPAAMVGTQVVVNAKIAGEPIGDILSMAVHPTKGLLAVVKNPVTQKKELLNMTPQSTVHYASDIEVDQVVVSGETVWLSKENTSGTLDIYRATLRERSTPKISSVRSAFDGTELSALAPNTQLQIAGTFLSAPTSKDTRVFMRVGLSAEESLPLLYASPTDLRVLIPENLPVGEELSLRVVPTDLAAQSQSSNVVILKVQKVALTALTDGSGRVRLWDEESNEITAVSPGQKVSLFLTGYGKRSKESQPGAEVMLLEPMKVFVDGLEVQVVLYQVAPGVILAQFALPEGDKQEAYNVEMTAAENTLRITIR